MAFKHTTGDPYDPDRGVEDDKFYTLERGGAGSDRVNLRITSETSRMLSLVARSGMFPHYMTQSDVLCDALVRILDLRGGQLGDTDFLNRLSDATVRADLDAEEERNKKTDDTVAKLVQQYYTGSGERRDRIKEKATNALKASGDDLTPFQIQQLELIANN